MKYYTLPKRFKTWAEYEQYRRKVSTMLDLLGCFAFVTGLIVVYIGVGYVSNW